SPVALESVGQISIIVKDVERARKFYRDTLGLTFLFEFPGMAFFDCGGDLLPFVACSEDLHLDQFVRGESGVDRGDDAVRQASLADLDGRAVAMSQSPQVSSL
ncbi:MAG: VOC family protein, partial [Thermoanaerobaculales bacterium]|nr:VOC family protein [Thermoanaerobaculales bacterium]